MRLIGAGGYLGDHLRLGFARPSAGCKLLLRNRGGNHVKDIRNSVFHADYTITDTEFRMPDALYKSSKGYLTHSVTFAELDSILRRSFAFYSAVMASHRRARRQRA
jgi:hypothetical protein